jgi:hypothetical protein
MKAVVYFTCEMACFRVTVCLQKRECIETIAEQYTNVERKSFPDALFVIFHMPTSFNAGSIQLLKSRSYSINHNVQLFTHNGCNM